MEGFKQGDIICTAKPFAYALSDSKRKLYCDYCLRGTEEPVFDRSNILAEATFRPKPKRCSQCQILYFCNQNCQQKAWVNFHKYECDRLKKCPLQTASLLIARIYIKLKQNLNGGRSVVDNIGGYNRTFDDLEQHRINIGKDVERSSMLLVAKSMLKNFCPDIFEETNKNDYNLIEEIYGKFTINSFEIVNYQFQSIGAGLYLGPSLLDHSCDPNAYVSFNGTACTIRAAREIPHRDMKNIFISYVDVALPKTIRQEKLEEQYYFTCNCDFCSHNTHEASKFEVLDPTKANLTNIISRSQNFMENHKVDMDPHGSDMIDKLTECNTILKLQEGILGEFHIYRMNLLDIALGYCLTLGLWDQALAIGLKLYDLNKLYYGETHCDHGDLSFKIAKLFLNKSDLDNGMLWLERARNVFETLLDEDHTLLGYLDQQIQRTQYEKHFANSIEGSKSNSTNKSYAVQTKYEAFYKGGHTEISYDGDYLFCMCGSKIQVLEIQSGKVIHTLGKDEDDEITTFTVDPNGIILVTASKNGLLQQWDWKNEAIVRTWKSLHSGPVKVMTISPNSTVLATGGSDSTVKVWDIVKQYCTHNLKGASGVFSILKFYPNTEKNMLYGAADDCTIRVWDLSKSSKHIGEFKGHFSLVTDLAFSNDGKNLISSGRDKVVLTWSIDDYQVKSTIPAFEGIESVITIPEGFVSKIFDSKTNDQYIITAGTKGVLKIWNLRTSSPVYTQINSLVAQTQDDDPEFPRIQKATYNSKLDAICVITHEHNIIFYKLEDFKLIKQFVGYNDEILDVCFLGENDTHIAVTTNSPMIKIFELKTFSCQVVNGHTDLVLTVRSFPSEKNRFVTGAKDNTLRLWEIDIETMDVLCLFVGSGHTLAVNAVACSSEFLVSGSQDTTLKVWDVPKRQYLVVATPSLNSRCTEKAHNKEINSVAISPNDKLIATASHDKTAKIWKSVNLELCGTLRGHRKGIWCIRFSPIDQIVTTSSADGTMKIWSLTTFACLKTFEGHDSSVLNVGFLSRGMQLITTASDGNMKLWTIKINECIKTTEAHQDKTWALAVSDNEEFLVTGGADSTIILWKDVSEEEKAVILAKEDSQILQEQKLSNYIQQKKWFKALKVAILLNQPYRALNIIKEILMQPEKESLEETIQKMREDQILSLLKFASTWNTNSKHCSAAQSVIHAVLKLYTPDELLKFSEIREHIEGLLPYTERHFLRLNRLQQQATFVDYLWQNMNVAGREVTEFKIPAPPNAKKKSFSFFEDRMKDSGVAKDLDTSSEMDVTETDVTETGESESDSKKKSIEDLKTKSRKHSRLQEEFLAIR